MSNHRNPVPEWLSATYVENILRKSFNEEKISVHSIEVTPGSSVGDNYACQVFRIIVDMSTNIKTRETLSLIAKYKPETTLLSELEKVIDLFDIEAQFFSKLQPQFKEVLKTIPNTKDYTPKCYHIDLEYNIIFMEDLKVKGFELQQRSKFLNLEQAELVMDALATYHGASLHTLRKYPQFKDFFHKYIWGKQMGTPVFKLMSNAADSLKIHVESYGLTEKCTKKLKNALQECENGSLEVVDMKEDGFNVLCHGDCWMNNMMFHSTNGIADDIMLLDFQVTNYNSFANDLQYFFFSSVQADVLVSKTDHLLQKYYQKLIAVAPEGTDVSLERIMSEFKQKYYFGYIMAIMFRPYLAAETPVDLDSVLLDNVTQDKAFMNENYINDLKKLLPIFEKAGIM